MLNTFSTAKWRTCESPSCAATFLPSLAPTQFQTNHTNIIKQILFGNHPRLLQVSQNGHMAKVRPVLQTVIHTTSPPAKLHCFIQFLTGPRKIRGARKEGNPTGVPVPKKGWNWLPFKLVTTPSNFQRLSLAKPVLLVLRQCRLPRSGEDEKIRGKTHTFFSHTSCGFKKPMKTNFFINK